MIPKITDLNLGEWTFTTKHGYFEGELKIKGTNICVGHCNSYDKKTLGLVSRLSNVSGGRTQIPYTEDVKVIHKEWIKLMEPLLLKLFK